ncbi:beta-ketoacyl-ACP synthase III [Cytophagaceae bacterium DM2B3-1]|uniref:Beta-ketoacyl-[acyl-carrier-protein] synthase III n=2 Tax=Xanthocytophaga TaxID=3078918 RepID=A0AAE3U8S6_9BACT|nr:MULTISPECIES: beta-ketoacyl-ACP synthase III [Xanthocytophaga]MDJ1469970.1 beta-ketoacyl-ACP synthase III [Xanthocytophaga flavus]MDJ1481488.1 beta-ketoacyl-ACP synthase III [Xanthocytophaga flavus]MDJ1491466.1 beta-ketoacyl-ACP synthase III [Xanthocytophaga flavus]MDJ1502412.1 beta-ketoacyl-ACP synthase III [Xanthocytophaga agilis]
MTAIKAVITGIHGYVPDYVLTNAELEKMVDTNDEWITSRTGIKERRILKGENQGSSHMGAKAVEGLLKKTNTDPLDIDLIICCTTTPDFVFPATANLISDMVGAKKAFSYDVQAACSGFLFSMVTASQFIETGRYKKIIVVGADKMSSIVDYQDRTTCIIFGDGAGAVLIEPSTDPSYGLQDFVLKTDGSGVEYLVQKSGGSRRPPSIETVTNREHFIHQEGATVFKFAVKNMADVAAEVMERNHLTSDDIAWLCPHQANLRIISATSQRMGIGEDKVMINIHKYGNTTDATLPLALWDYEHLLKKGDNIIFAAFGGGFTWGAAYMKWAYDGSKFA